MAEITAISPLATEFPSMPSLRGLSLRTLSAELRYRGRDDLCGFLFDKPSPIAAVFTRSATVGAPIDWNRECLSRASKVRAIIVNAGNANAFTGRAGAAMCSATAAAFAESLGCDAHEIWLASTGVIGDKPAADYIARHSAALLASSDKDWHAAARAIMTTDTFVKGAVSRFDLAGEPVTIAGIAKGSGMIAPDLATMLSFIVTDARLPQALLQSALQQAVAESFNCVTVDGDCSTSDMVLLASTGAVSHANVSTSSRAYESFVDALKEVAVSLAKSIAADGEGAKKFITVRVRGAEDFGSARRVGLCIANSPLVKTAIAGEDANWGRIVMAIGKSGVRVDRDKLDIAFGDYVVARSGEAVLDYDESRLLSYMGLSHIDIGVDLHLGSHSAEVWSCDLTYDYIRINADYRS